MWRAGFAEDVPVIDGQVALPDLPGIGFEAKRDLFEMLRSVHTETCRVGTAVLAT
jgi:L-alanine-DL-glutamate epimerase-like enolase superfamily enzyme